MSTYVQLFNNVKRRCGIASESQWDADIRQYLNDGQQEIASRYFWPFLMTQETVTTVSGTDTYALANPCTVMNVRDTTNRVSLKFVDVYDFDRYYPNNPAQGVPRLYRVIGETKPATTAAGTPNVVLYPVPAGAYSVQVREYMELPDLVNDADISMIPPRYHLALVHYAAAAFHESRGDARSVANRDLFEGMVTSMAEQYDATPADAVWVLRSEDEKFDPRLLQYPPSYGDGR